MPFGSLRRQRHLTTLHDEEPPIIADVPRTDPGLGFAEYAEALADAIRGGQPAQFTIGIYGEWGSGKSSLLNAVAKNLSQKTDVVPVLFDAWRYERSGHIVVPLLHRIYRTTAVLGNTKVSGYLRQALLSVVYSLKFNLGVVELDMKKLQKPEEEADLIPLDHAFDRPFADMSNLSNALKDVRIAVLIDDLDRCSPENIVSVLESINLIMDIPGFIFVLALDYDVLIKAVSYKYPHASGHVFIEKMVQAPFRVPRLDLQAEDFLVELVPGWRKRTFGFPKDFLDYINDIASLALQANPRQIKRLINSFLVLRRIVDQRSLEVENSLLAALIGLQLRWPEQYSDFAASVFAGDEKPYDVLYRDEDEPSLRQYAERFFSQPASSDKLRQLLQLTQAVAPQEYEQEDTQTITMSDLREVNRVKLMTELRSLGFFPSARKESAYYNRQLPGTRFVIGKHYFRVEEKRKDGRFHLSESFLLTRDSEEAVETIRKAVTGSEPPLRIPM